MQRSKGLLMPAIKNIANAWGYGEQWIFPIVKQKITLQGVNTYVHVCRLGVNEYQKGVSDLLIYVDGFGGVTTEVPTKAFCQNKKKKKVVVDVEGTSLRIDFNPSIEKKKVDVKHNGTQWGYYNAQKAFIPLDALPTGPVEIDVVIAEHTEFIEEIAFLHPNLIVMKPDGVEWALQLFNEDFSQFECLHDNWHDFDGDQIEKIYGKIVAIVDAAETPREANTAFYKWWHEREKGASTSGKDKECICSLFFIINFL